MINKNQEFKEILKDFVQKIKSTEEALKCKFNFTESPYSVAGKKFRKKGESVKVDTEEIKIWFHDAGCTYIFSDGLEVNYSIAPITVNSIKIFPWSLYKFIKTSERYTSVYPIEILNFCEKLEKEGILLRYIEGYDFFEICESWTSKIVKGLPN